jgi:HK97 family phage prohead protease
MADEWLQGMQERFNKMHAPAGSAAGGQFAASSGSSAGKGKDTRPTPSNEHPVGQGETGKRVSDLQARLNEMGASLKVDGTFGPKTLAAVKAFQKAHGLKVDGLVGPKTTAALRGKAPAAQHGPAHPATHAPAKTTPKKAPRGTEPEGDDRGSDLKYGHGSALWKYWTKGEGFAKWSGAVHKWRTLRDLLLKAGVPPLSVDGLTTNIIQATMPGYMKQAHKKGRSAVDAADVETRSVAADCIRSVPFQITRAEGDGRRDGLTFEGYAAVFNRTALIPDAAGEFEEQIAPGAFTESLARRKPVLMFEHGKHPLIGSMPLGVITDAHEDQRGLFISARLSDNWLIQPVRDAVRDGAVNGMSFRFYTPGDGDQRWEKRDGKPDLRTLLRLDPPELGPVVFPAYEPTTATVRSLLDGLEKDFTGRDGARSAPGGEEDDASQENGGTSPPVNLKAALRDRVWRMRRHLA